MSKETKWMMVVAVAAMFAVAAPASAELVGHWAMDEASWTGETWGPSRYQWTNNNPGEVLDSSGSANVHNGTAAYQATTVADGKFGRAGTFDGSGGPTGDFVTIGDHADFEGMAALTIASWVRYEPWTENWSRVIVSKQYSGTDGYGVSMQVRGGVGWQNRRFRFYLETTDGKAYADTDWYDSVAGGSWIHVVSVYDGSNMNIYLDGNATPIATGAQTGTVITSSNRLIIAGNTKGYSYGGTGTDWKGQIDDVGIWNEALTTTQIANIYANGIPEPATLSLLVLGGIGVVVRRRRR